MQACLISEGYHGNVNDQRNGNNKSKNGSYNSTFLSHTQTHTHIKIIMGECCTSTFGHIKIFIHVRIENPGSILIQLHNVFNVSACVCVCVRMKCGRFFISPHSFELCYTRRENAHNYQCVQQKSAKSQCETWFPFSWPIDLTHLVGKKSNHYQSISHKRMLISSAFE